MRPSASSRWRRCCTAGECALFYFNERVLVAAVSGVEAGWCGLVSSVDGASCTWPPACACAAFALRAVALLFPLPPSPATPYTPKMQRSVIGQEEAVSAIARAIRRARVGLKNPNRPIASFIFAGPTGVGKSELAKTLASYYFGSEEAMVRGWPVLRLAGKRQEIAVHAVLAGRQSGRQACVYVWACVCVCVVLSSRGH